MEKCLLSVDWDYFVYTQHTLGLYMENERSLDELWYKRYIQAMARGKDIKKAFQLSPEVDTFWDRIKQRFKFVDGIKAYVSDSHALSYKIAKENHCNVVYLFDTHSDLGYGGLSSLNYDVNCSNWLGKLLKDKQIKEANIIYSPYTAEKPEHFKLMNRIYNIRYYDFNDLNVINDPNDHYDFNDCNDFNYPYDLNDMDLGDLSDPSGPSDLNAPDNLAHLDNSDKYIDKYIEISVIHICRSGAWAPPWLDNNFIKFIDALGLPYEVVDCPKRKWDPVHISLSKQIDYLLA